MASFRFSHAAQKQFDKLEPENRDRIIKKLKELKNHPSFFSILEPVTEIDPATHRIRIGDYRLLVCMYEENWIILKIGHRRDIYR